MHTCPLVDALPSLTTYMWSALTRDLWRRRGWVRWFIDNGLAPSGSCRQSDKQIRREEGDQGRFLLHDLIHTLQVLAAVPSLTY